MPGHSRSKPLIFKAFVKKIKIGNNKMKYRSSRSCCEIMRSKANFSLGVIVFLRRCLVSLKIGWLIAGGIRSSQWAFGNNFHNPTFIYYRRILSIKFKWVNSSRSRSHCLLQCFLWTFFFKEKARTIAKHAFLRVSCEILKKNIRNKANIKAKPFPFNLSFINTIYK